jgi:hypothetical protein
MMMHLGMYSKLQGEDGLRLMTQLVINTYETGEWPKDFTEFTISALRKKPEATKCIDHRTISLIAYTPKIVARILRRGIERKIEDVFGEDHFGFRRGKGYTDVTRRLKIITERILNIDEELCACVVDWQKEYERVNWTKLMQILKGTGIDWHERRLIRKLYRDHDVKYDWTKDRREDDLHKNIA